MRKRRRKRKGERGGRGKKKRGGRREGGGNKRRKRGHRVGWVEEGRRPGKGGEGVKNIKAQCTEFLGNYYF